MKKKRYEKPVSLHPISLEDALRGALQVPPPDDKPSNVKAKKKVKRKKKKT